MATISKRKSGKWTAQIRTHKRYISKTFLKKSNASNWAKEIEYQLDREQYEDFSDSARLTLGDLIRKYRDEITPNKKGGREEAYKLNLLLRHKIAKCRLLDLKAKISLISKVISGSIENRQPLISTFITSTPSGRRPRSNGTSPCPHGTRRVS